MDIPNIKKNKAETIWLRENKNDSHMLDICTTDLKGKIICWGCLHSDFWMESVFGMNPISWEGLPEDKSRIKAIGINLNLVDYESI